jgi:thiol-disulfide isomerase/thioredoxin
MNTIVHSPDSEKTVEIEPSPTRGTQPPLRTETAQFEESSQPIATTEPLSYPLPQGEEGYPIPNPTTSDPNSPTIALGGTPTSTQIPTLTSEDGYPLPEDPDFGETGEDFLFQDPYPGPDDQGFPTEQITQEGDESTFQADPASPTESIENFQGEPESSLSLPIPGRVRTDLVASDPANFSLASGEIQLVEFFAVWAPISSSMAPVMNSLEDQYKGRIRFVYLDLDDPANALYLHLSSDRLPPLFFLLDGDGRVIHEWQGFIKREEFEAVFATVY